MSLHNNHRLFVSVDSNPNHVSCRTKRPPATTFSPRLITVLFQ